MKTKKLYFILLSAVFTLFAILLFSKTGHVIIDFSRESYIPYQMLQGQKLIKDIFLIYGFWGYFVNFLLYKIYLNFNLLLVEAIFLGYLCSLAFFMILKKYVRYKVAFVFTIFFITVNVFANSVFSFVFPYSYSTLWAVLAVFLIVYSILYKKSNLMYLALGLCFVSKIEFFIAALILVIINAFYKKEFQLKSAIYSFIFPLIFLFYILISQISLNDIMNNFSYIHKMLNTSSLDFFYSKIGTFFDFDYFKYNLINLFLYFVVSLFSYSFYKYSKILSFSVLLIGFYIVHLPVVYNLAFFAALILSAVNYKKFRYKDFVLLYFGFILCSKSVFALNTHCYANFAMAIVLFYIYYQFSKIINKDWLFIHLIIVVVLLNSFSIKDFFNQSRKEFATNLGSFYLSKNHHELFYQVTSYLDKNLKKDDDFVVLPEGQIFNLIYKKPWKFFNSTFTPLDFETFGKENLTLKLKENNPSYIIFYPRDTMEYGAKTICEDYAIDFCSYIMDNYSVDLMFKNKYKVVILKRNEK